MFRDWDGREVDCGPGSGLKVLGFGKQEAREQILLLNRDK